jgi:hypothetical protein
MDLSRQHVYRILGLQVRSSITDLALCWLWSMQVGQFRERPAQRLSASQKDLYFL